jgi:excisionase family DNA binding protein
MLRGALSSHRSVMTVREAATYLRIPSTSVERLAMEGNLPGFMIEGSWRFLKTTIDDWVSARQTFPEEGLHDVA